MGGAGIDTWQPSDGAAFLEAHFWDELPDRFEDQGHVGSKCRAVSKF
jgi:hypothetical protein